MSTNIKVRTVAVELLRAGPPHNQLLSPLTQYLGVCGDSGAGIVTLPYEHRTFERRLRYLRYEGGVDDAERRALLHDTGVEMAKILGSVPGLPGALTDESNQSDTLIHLRLILSASELALLPFELSKIPVGPGASSPESWLALQTRAPVCITRQIRTVTSEGVQWPTEVKILFVAAEPRDIPFEEHRQVLLDAIAPFRFRDEDEPEVSADGRREQWGRWLTILKDATFEDVEQECTKNRYTHVHILAHGALDNTSEGTSFGLALRGLGGEPDVVSGERFASVLCSLASGRLHRPTVVTAASCDSGQQGSVLTPGSSFAHALHQAGIPLVVASQFPLSKVGSVSVTRTLYRGFVWGQAPWILLHEVRSELHGRHSPSSHDWASLVVYEALPADVCVQLEEVTYCQARRAIDTSLDRIDDAVRDRRSPLPAQVHRRLVRRLERAREHLPMEGAFVTECLGLCATSFKRQAHAEFELAKNAGADGETHLLACHELLEQAFLSYQEAVKAFLVNRGKRRDASLHWVLVQLLCHAVVLGRRLTEELWMAAKIAAEMYLEHPDIEQRAWAHGSLAELWLLRLAEPTLYPPERSQNADRARYHAGQLRQLFPVRKAFPVASTARQFSRYVDWWGDPGFAAGWPELQTSREELWQVEGGVLETAASLVAILEPRSRKIPGIEPARLPASGVFSPRPEAGEPEAAKRLAANAPAASGPAASGPAASGPAASGPAAGGPAASGPAASGPAASGPAAGVPAASVPAASGPAASVPAAGVPAAGRSDNGRSRNRASGEGIFHLEMLPAGHGDCLLLEYGDPRARSRVLIDCGTRGTDKRLRARLETLPPGDRRFDLFVLTHIDADHIGGAIPFFNKGRDLGLEFGDLWYNGWKHLPHPMLGARQGEIFSTLIDDLGLAWNRARDGGTIVVEDGELPVHLLPGGLRLTLLSPTPERLARLQVRWQKELRRHGLEPGSRRDYRRFLRGTRSTSTDVDALAETKFKSDAGAPNGSSIAFLAEFEGRSALLVGDAHVPVLIDSIGRLLQERGQEKLRLDALKVSHHGSQKNLSNDLLRLLDCDRYLVSTNGSHFHHPDREAIARIIKYGGAGSGRRPKIYFNYKTEDNQIWAREDLKEKYGYEAHYPEEGKDGVTVRLDSQP